MKVKVSERRRGIKKPSKRAGLFLHILASRRRRKTCQINLVIT
jgi:hypothetical protein